MNSHHTAKVVSLLALLVTLGPTMLYAAGTLGHDSVKWLTLAGTIIWFVATPLWLKDQDAADESLSV